MTHLRLNKCNLKKEFNWRGDIAELLVKYVLREGAYRTKGYSYEPYGLKEDHENFLKKQWDTIDLFGFDYESESNLTIYEVKTRNFGVRRRPDLTKKSLNCYLEAEGLGIKIFVITVYFHENWELSFEIKEFNKEDFRENDGGWYRRK